MIIKSHRPYANGAVELLDDTSGRTVVLYFYCHDFYRTAELGQHAGVADYRGQVVINACVRGGISRVNDSRYLELIAEGFMPLKDTDISRIAVILPCPRFGWIVVTRACICAAAKIGWIGRRDISRAV